jgi:ribosome-associated protein
MRNEQNIQPIAVESTNKDDTHQMALLSARAAIDKKSENVKILNLSQCSSLTDYFVICSGMSTRQVQAIADAVKKELTQHGLPLLATEGYREGRWVLLDFGSVIVHIFLDAVREYYDLESVWPEAPRVRVPSEYYGSAASRLN